MERTIAGYIDQTLLKPYASYRDVRVLCKEASEHGFAAVCIRPKHVAFAVENIRNYNIKTVVCSVVGFPLDNLPLLVAVEASVVIGMGAMEVDMVADIGALTQGEYNRVRDGIAMVVMAARQANPQAIVKVILESHLLTNMELVKGCKASKEAGAHFVKTCTGFSGGGATVAHVQLMRETVGDHMGVKASGGIKCYIDAMAMIKAGASRIGASAGVQIVKEAQSA